MNMERRHGEDKPVIKKALVELDGKPFKYFEANRDTWKVKTSYTYPGAIQYYGPTEVCDLTTRTLALEKGEQLIINKGLYLHDCVYNPFFNSE